ncbi:alpha/beta hydrolase [Legionella impletisoli]|uniref:Membrane protein n=1 Tax=Legionella impletisoli TaxID=343510 RepID=A0A917NCW8_9GAMM|nr:hypothetical protein [Legionella impletisoli]GGI89006.1 membrane protein [Legionella impletisoli]
MNIKALLNEAGEHSFLRAGTAGEIEGILSVPNDVRFDFVAILGHPHSLQGGSMNNKVVTTMSRAFKELCIPSIRFNFRGVGQTDGEYDAGIGESEDMLAITDYWQKAMPEAKFIFAGFSFGSYVVYRVAAQHEHELLITVAPPVHHYDYEAFQHSPSPWIILQGDEDEVVPKDFVLKFAEELSLPVLEFPKTGHFFHGRLVELKARLIDEIRRQVPTL